MKHGGDLSQAMPLYGGAVQDWLDLSTGINPEPWPVESSLLTDTFYRLPAHVEEEALIEAARNYYNVPKDVSIVAAPGAQSLIQWLPHLACAGDVAIFGPTYSEHARSWQRAGRIVTDMCSIEQLPQNIRHAVIVNPNNPDGRIVAHAQLAATAEEIKQRGGWLIVDESFADIDPALGCARLCSTLPIVVLRSFGKFFGMPGLRLGFLIVPPDTALLFRAALGPWPVSGPALLIGAAALQDRGWANRTRVALTAKARQLDTVLETANLKIIGGMSLFRLVHHADAKSLHEKLAQKHIWCRRFDDTPDCLRFGLPRNDQDLVRLKKALLSS